jgi:hypothetical protein
MTKRIVLSALILSMTAIPCFAGERPADPGSAGRATAQEHRTTASTVERGEKSKAGEALTRDLASKRMSVKGE